MADSTTNMDTIATTDAGKEVKVNNFMDAASYGTAFGRRATACSGLVWGYYGISRVYVNGVAVVKANTTITLTASSTRYLAADRALAVTDNATAFPPEKLALAKIVTGTATVTSYEDHRNAHNLNRFLYGRYILAMADANKTLTYEQAMCESLELTGALTALRDVVVPTVVRAYTIFANTSGGFGVQVKTSAGTGITVPDGQRCTVECDGTNVKCIDGVLVVSSTAGDGANLSTGTATGTKLGTSTTQKLGFWNASPVVQPASANQAAVTMGNADGEIGGLTISVAYDQAEVQALRDKCEELADDVRALSTLVHQLRSDSVTIGLIKGSA